MSSLSVFPILKLPILCIESILNQFEVYDNEHLRFYPFRFTDPQQTLKSAISYFMDLFNIHVRRVNIAPDEFPNTRKFIFPGCNQCEKVRITGNIPIKTYMLKHFLESFKITECLSFNIPFESDFYLDPIHFAKDEIHFLNSSSNWITRDVFFNLKNQRIQMYDCDISKVNVKDFELFVDRWYHSNDTEFEILVMMWNVFPGILDIERFNPMPWDKNKRSKSIIVHPDFEIDCSEGMDIERSDGSLATVSKRINNMILFYVWNGPKTCF
ncbi:hypothetical protein GCK72_005286 [Caenorhabditis remanei]|uniref:F-box associated domain-containing protein n=1 Tax=Caenorhabditis remanei TaxID=31234 RepID=A0A6A5HET9_CAERE|nr:hypothetical protein GCK72_005286 [Caenorhabditis remanei]KAF1765334.1 hypothetical protein GCK72_005286 [Caenorhabditis remanei]